MLDRIVIDDLKIYAHHGYYDFEKNNGQDFFVSAVLYLDFEKAATTDDLELTVNYNDVCIYIIELMTSKVFDTIEAVSQYLAVCILNKFKAVCEIDIEVRKPDAPVDAQFESISVKVNRKRHRAYIAYGSNEGDSVAIIENALSDIDNDEAICIINKSKMIKSTPYGGVEQNTFYNGVIEIDTYYSPMILLDVLHKIEAKYKRVREVHWGPRTLDLDIIFYDDIVLDSKELVIPHPDMQNRDFVLMPLAEIAGYYRHPISKLTVNDMCKRINESHIIS